MISLTLTDLDRLTGRKCATCKGSGERWQELEKRYLAHHKVVEALTWKCIDCKGTGWAVEPMRVEVCVDCRGRKGNEYFFEESDSWEWRDCPTCAGTGERWPDVLLTVDVFDPIQLGIAVAAQRNVKTGLGFTNKLRVNIFAAAAAYQGRVFFRVESEASARAFAERMKLGNDNASSIYRAKIELTGNTDSICWPLPNVIPVAVLGRECETCDGDGRFDNWLVMANCPDCNATGTIPATQAEADALLGEVCLIPARHHATYVLGLEDVGVLNDWYGDINNTNTEDGIDILFVPQQVLGSVGVPNVRSERDDGGCSGFSAHEASRERLDPAGETGTEPNILPSGEESYIESREQLVGSSRVGAPTAGSVVQLLEDALEARVEVLEI